jgi:hypothetical protein
MQEGCKSGLPQRIARARAHERADALHPLSELRARRERPYRGSGEQRDESAPSHAIISCARADRGPWNVQLFDQHVARSRSPENLST